MRFKNKIYAVTKGDEYYELTREEILKKLDTIPTRLNTAISHKGNINGYTIKQIPDFYTASIDGVVIATASSWNALGYKIGFNPEYLATKYRRGEVAGGKYVLNRYQLTKDRINEPKPMDYRIHGQTLKGFDNVIKEVTHIKGLGSIYYSDGEKINLDDINNCLEVLKRLLNGKVIVANDKSSN